jgi:hypothetical protein
VRENREARTSAEGSHGAGCLFLAYPHTFVVRVSRSPFAVAKRVRTLWAAQLRPVGNREGASSTYSVASSCLSIGFRKTGFQERQAAMVNIGSTHWKQWRKSTSENDQDQNSQVHWVKLLTSPFRDKDQQEGGPGESVSRLVGVCQSLSYHVRW